MAIQLARHGMQTLRLPRRALRQWSWDGQRNFWVEHQLGGRPSRCPCAECHARLRDRLATTVRLGSCVPPRANGAEQGVEFLAVDIRLSRLNR
jgi:hypothetical protein